MPKPQKLEAVAELKKKFEDADGAILAAFRGLKVQEIKELRRSLAPTEFKVVKNTLARRAVSEASLDDLLPLLEGSTAIAFIKGDPIAAAKSLDDIAKKYPALEIKGGLIEGRVLDASRASALAKVKPREVMLSQLAGMFQQPLQQLVNLLNAPLRSLAYGLGAYREKLAKEAPAPSPEAPTEEAIAPEAPTAEAAEPESPIEDRETNEPKEE